MQGGRVRQVGTPEEIYLYPADTFVATFIGTPPMNLIDMPGEVLGVRPENLMPESFFGREENLRRMTMLVSRIEFLGSDKLIYGLLDDPFGQAKVIARLPSSVPADIREGVRSIFAVRESELRYFDPETGRTRDVFANREIAAHG
jgi:multiple sugar transport system ATP-binding protein